VGVWDEQRYRAVQSRDRRFDGWFVVAVHTTGIYCRPSCPATTPRRENVSFFPAAAAAQQRGFRACKRCRPDASPGSPEWNARGDVVARAMRLIADGVIDREGVPGLSRRLGYSDRHLNRLLTAEIGAGPVAIARAQRAQTARMLIETTSLPMTDVAFAAGFASVRQFNDTVREVFAASPTELRASRRPERDAPTSAAGAGAVTLRLPAREPFAADDLFRFLGHRAVPGVESWDGSTYARTLRLPGGPAVVALRADGGAVSCTMWLTAVADLQAAVQRCRRLLDLDADPVAVDAHLATDRALSPLVRAVPGLRAAGAVDGAEMVVRGVLGQQVSVAGARTVTDRLAAVVGERVAVAPPDLGLPATVFPSAAAIAGIDPALLPMPAARRRALVGACVAVASGRIVVDEGADRSRLVDELAALPGIGPWTAQYVAMRALGDPDAFLPTDLGVRRAMTARGLDATPAAALRRAQRWSPWRTYALHHLWRSLGPAGPGAATTATAKGPRR
jgi:AraC family transcriptional regulator of adaptative response / DNA-3-methyladenine glycosylase II